MTHTTTLPRARAHLRHLPAAGAQLLQVAGGVHAQQQRLGRRARLDQLLLGVCEDPALLQAVHHLVVARWCVFVLLCVGGGRRRASCFELTCGCMLFAAFCRMLVTLPRDRRHPKTQSQKPQAHPSELLSVKRVQLLEPKEADVVVLLRL